MLPCEVKMMFQFYQTECYLLHPSQGDFTYHELFSETERRGKIFVHYPYGRQSLGHCTVENGKEAKGNVRGIGGGGGEIPNQ